MYRFKLSVAEKYDKTSWSLFLRNIDNSRFDTSQVLLASAESKEAAKTMGATIFGDRIEWVDNGTKEFNLY